MSFVLLLNNISHYYIMRIRSSYFKKDYDLNKAELVGKGTFAEVFRVFDSDFNDSIAIRKVKKSQGDLEDIAKEKQINQELRKVQNENILKIFDIIEQPDIVWYITEYCSGGSLWDALNLCKDNKMNEKESLECILQVSKGVQELHNHRITHRDLKPENILLKTKYVAGKPLPLIKLADFGLSTQKIIMETIAGTKEYIAPEQAKFHNYTNAVDVWSLGIIFDEILHGTLFYSGEDNKEVFNKILKTPFKVRNEDLRPSIKDLLSSLLKKKPYERPIIAVIRSTIQKILEEIEASTHPQSVRKSITENTSDGSKLSEPKMISNDSKPKIITTPAKDHNVFSKKTYETNSKEKEKAEKPVINKDVSPINKEVSLFRKPISTDKKQEELSKQVSAFSNPKEGKDQNRQNLLTENKSFEKKAPAKSEMGETDRSKIERKAPVKVQSVSKTPQMSNIAQKITIFKTEKRKLINSNVKKEQYKCEIVSLTHYSQKVSNHRNELACTIIKLQSQLQFIPNQYLNGSEFSSQKCGSSQLVLRDFKKPLDFLNYFSTSQDYQIRLAKAERELKPNRFKAQQYFYKIQQSVKQIFLAQLDSFVDHYIDKALK